MIRFPENSFDPDLSLERISRRQKFNTNGFEKYLKSAISFLSGSLDTFFSRYPLTEITHRFFVTSDGRRQYIAASDGKSVAVLDLLNLTWLEIDGATTINLEGVHSLKWVGRDSSTLLVGTNFGFAAYSISSLGLSRATFFPHPHRKPISRLDAAPYGRLVVTWSRGDSCLYIWDILLGSFTPVLFGDGSDCDFSWSPSGSHIAIHRR
jgi:WD40 repeat protein